MADQTVASLFTQSIPREQIFIDDRDREVLRRLAGTLAELAARPVEAERRELWYRHNALEPTRPVVFCDPENGWNEIVTPPQLECEGELARPTIDEDRIRRQLRRVLQTTRDCRVEVIMKDNHTIGNNPENVTCWCRIAQEEADRT